MRELEETLTKYGDEFRQILNTDWGYVYERSSNDGCISYEVFKRLENKKYNCVSFPSDKAFGRWAWAYRTPERAVKKLYDIKPIENGKN